MIVRVSFGVGLRSIRKELELTISDSYNILLTRLITVYAGIRTSGFLVRIPCLTETLPSVLGSCEDM